ncbi:RHS repeat-associated core domain-containing protein [Paenibacillus sp. KN14-4R]|uniref:RHS repeat-associated core domain-containing protein n=1 Tax=Paenibacillus sp. KN14-4R TaxID=3445773 RepID=UPI003FA15A41
MILLKQVTYPDGNSIEKVYDQSGNLLIEKDENKNQTLHAYDKEGNQKTLTDRQGNTFTYEYDSRNRLKKKTATNREIGLYDPEITFDYDLAGRMITTNDYTGTTKYQYDYATGGSQAKLGLLQSISYPDGKQLSYEYDIAGQVTSMTDPFGKVTNYAYQAGRLDKVGQDLTNPDASYTYKAGNLDRIDLNTGKIVTNHVYTEGMLSDVTHKTDVGQALGSYGYEYDDYANITKLKENSQVTSSLTYDSLHRVQTNSMFKEAYQYNNRGNRETLQSDQLPQIPLNQYKYDSRDQLIEVKAPAKNNGEAKQVAYVYNGQGLMIKRTEANQVDEGDKRVSRYYYDADANIIAEEKTEGDKTSQYSYIRSGGQLVAKVDQAGSKQYYLHNGHGDVVSITDDQGNKLAEYKYDIWGKILPAEDNNLVNKVDNIFFYSGEYYDELTELQYLRARWYDPSIGRFIQEDRYEGQNDNPLSLNLYTYAENNPLIYTDPTGYNPFALIPLTSYAVAAVEAALIATTVYIEEKYFNKPVVQQPWVEQKPTVSIREWQSKNPTILNTPYIQQKLTTLQQGEKINTSGVLTSGAKGTVSGVVNGNSKVSTKPQHGYEIYEKGTGDRVKTGISGQPLNKNGTSPRANSQVNRWNNEVRYDKYAAEVVKTKMANRQEGLEWEEKNSQRLWEEGNSMSRHKRPRPWEK